MQNDKNLEWFKNEVGPILKDYEIDYNYFENGDFGSLNQVEFNSKEIGGNIDFWELGWLGVFAWDYKKEQVILNVLVEPNNHEKKSELLVNLVELLKSH
jgi:hypothetical protein